MRISRNLFLETNPSRREEEDEDGKKDRERSELIEFYFTHKWSFAGNRTDDDDRNQTDK